MSLDRVVIRSYRTMVEADLAKLRLNTVGIRSYIIVRDNIFGGAIGGYELSVDSGHASRASKLIEDYEKDMSSHLDSLTDDEIEGQN